MSYVLVGILLILIGLAFVAYLVLTATKRSSPATSGDSAPADAPGIGAGSGPFGDTEQHAGEQTGGRTVGGSDAEHKGGTGRPVRDDPSTTDDPAPHAPDESRRFQRDPIGGEAEARPFTESEA
jgi:hypothetical protein